VQLHLVKRFYGNWQPLRICTDVPTLKPMKKQYDFSKGKRGTVVLPSRGKSRVTIRLDTRFLTGFVEKFTRPAVATIRR